jgi:hypothetical protein
MSEARRMISRDDYIELCRRACSRQPRVDQGETLEDAYWYKIWQAILNFLELDTGLQPVEGAPMGQVYRVNIQQVVSRRKSEHFDSLAIPHECIKEAMGQKWPC